MALFAIVLVAFLITLIGVLIPIGIAGIGFIILFGDLIVFILIMRWILRRLFRRKRK